MSMCFPFSSLPRRQAGRQGRIQLLLLKTAGRIRGAGLSAQAKLGLHCWQHPGSHELPEPCFTHLVFIYPVLLMPPSSKFLF